MQKRRSKIDLSVSSPLDWPTFGVSVMDRYIARELILPFLFGVGAFSSIAISIGALFDLIRRVAESGLSLTIAIEVFFLKLPGFLVLAFPMSMLLATMMTYSRFSSDSELIALRGMRCKCAPYHHPCNRAEPICDWCDLLQLMS